MNDDSNRSARRGRSHSHRLKAGPAKRVARSARRQHRAAAQRARDLTRNEIQQ